VNFPWGAGGIDRIVQRLEEGALGLQGLDHLQQMAERTGEAVQADDDQDVAGLHRLQQAIQDRPGTAAAGGMFIMDFDAARNQQLVGLRQGGLIFGGDAGVDSKCHGSTPGRAHGAAVRSRQRRWVAENVPLLELGGAVAVMRAANAERLLN
jgi:hypothetical protein